MSATSGDFVTCYFVSRHRSHFLQNVTFESACPPSSNLLFHFFKSNLVIKYTLKTKVTDTPLKILIIAACSSLTSTKINLWIPQNYSLNCVIFKAVFCWVGSGMTCKRVICKVMLSNWPDEKTANKSNTISKHSNSRQNMSAPALKSERNIFSQSLSLEISSLEGRPLQQKMSV